MAKIAAGPNLSEIVPFDQYSRQTLAKIIIDASRQHDEPFKILDVGGYQGRTADFLKDDEVTVLDLFDVKERNYVKGDALDMPFKDGSYDFVVSFDVLEHIPENKRDTFTHECARVAKEGVIVAGPHKTRNNEKAEMSLNKLYKTLQGQDHQWLAEHISYGLPEFDKVKQKLTDEGFFVSSKPSNETMLWQLMQGAIFLNSKSPIAAESLVKLNEYYNKYFTFENIEREAAYRLVLYALRHKDKFESVQQTLSQLKSNPAAERLSLVSKIQNFEATLVKKMGNLEGDYEKLYVHEQERSEQLEKNNRELWIKLNELSRQLDLYKQRKNMVARTVRKGRRRLGSLVRKVSKR